MEGACCRGYFPAQAQPQLLQRRHLPVGPVHLVWPPVPLARTCLYQPQGTGRVGVQRVRLTIWCLVKAGEELLGWRSQNRSLGSTCPGVRTKADLAVGTSCH